MIRFHVKGIMEPWTSIEKELVAKVLENLNLGYSLEETIFRELMEFKDVSNLLVAEEFSNFFGSKVKAVLSYIILDIYFYTYFLINVWRNYVNSLDEVDRKEKKVGTDSIISRDIWGEERRRPLFKKLSSLLSLKPKPKRKRLTLVINELNFEGVKFPKDNFSATEGYFEVRIDPMHFTKTIPKEIVKVDEEWMKKFFSLFPYWKKLVKLAERLDRIPGDEEMMRISDYILRKLEIRVDTNIDKLIRKYVEVLWEIRKLCKKEGEPFQLFPFYPKDIV